MKKNTIPRLNFYYSTVEKAYRRQRVHLIWMARAFGLDVFEAEDIVQDIFVSLLACVDRLDCTKPLNGYLERMLVYAVRHERLRRKACENFFSDSNLVQASKDRRGDYWAAEVTIREVLSGIASHEQQLLLACYRDGYNHEEVALMHGVSRRTYFRRLSRARSELRRSLRRDKLL